MITLIQSRSFINRNSNLLIFSLVIKIAILVNKAVLDEIIIPAPGLINPIVEVPIALPTSISVIINNTFFLFNFLYFFYNNHYQL